MVRKEKDAMQHSGDAMTFSTRFGRFIHLATSGCALVTPKFSYSVHVRASDTWRVMGSTHSESVFYFSALLSSVLVTN